jgi:5-formyltetrahydrofolate cyclo-ligase
MNNPAQIRKEILAARDRLTEPQRHSKSLIICNSLLSLDTVKKAQNIFIYVNFRSEVETVQCIKTLLEAGKQVTVPLTNVKEKRLDIIELIDPDADLVPGYCGIPEPREDLVAGRSRTALQLEIIVLPGSVFDLRGGRFGYGGGYYDRLLSQVPQAKRIALAFEQQIIEKLPLQEHDEILDCIITEKRIIHTASRNK